MDFVTPKLCSTEPAKSSEPIKLIRKLRWIGMEEEARRIEMVVDGALVSQILAGPRSAPRDRDPAQIMLRGACPRAKEVRWVDQ